VIASTTTPPTAPPAIATLLLFDLEVEAVVFEFAVGTVEADVLAEVLEKVLEVDKVKGIKGFVGIEDEKLVADGVDVRETLAGMTLAD